MNKTAIKNFAIWARNKLIADISYRAGLMGITADGIHQALPQSTGQTKFYEIGTPEPYAISGEAIHQREHLADLIRRKAKDSNYQTAYKYIIEEVAYTWFNRLIAVRFMEVNDYLPSHIRVLSSDQGKIEPDLVTIPFDADLDFTRDEQQTIMEFKSENKLDELFRLLFIKQCNALNEILPALFEKTNDYTELLLNMSVIDHDGVVYHLVHDIPEEDFNVERGGQVEIIGWLYQYYISEKHEEVVDPLHGKIVRKEEIPAATQLFTTDWVVRYLVDNSDGRYWLEHNQNSKIIDKLDYYIKSNNSSNNKEKNEIVPQELTVFDPCVGSGHFLVYAFELLMHIYVELGYSEREAASEIIKHNLYGLDIDKRAVQLSYFALMMKARQYDRRFFVRGVQPHVYDIVESNHIDSVYAEFFYGDNQELKKNTELLINTFKDAKEYGSVIQLPNINFEMINCRINEIQDDLNIYSVYLLEEFKPIIDVAEVMARQYSAVVTNPPYLNKYDDKLKSYIVENYNDYKGDIFSVFIHRNFGFCKKDGYTGFMTPFVWMFIKTYSKLREEILKDKSIITLIQMEYSAFEEATVPICAFVLKNGAEHELGKYIRLSSFTGGMEVQRKKTLEAINNPNCGYYYETSVRHFLNIPGSPLAYWVSEKFVSAFKNEQIAKYAISDGQTKTGNNSKYLRNIWEVSATNVGKDSKWAIIAKGGNFRRWAGNVDTIIDWSQTARLHYKSDHVARIAPEYIWFRKGVCWNHITSGNLFAARFIDENMLFETAAPAIFFDDDELLFYVIGYLNSPVSGLALRFINPTISTNVGDITSQPLIYDLKKKDTIIPLVKELILLSTADWNDYETAWGFKKHPLVINNSLQSVEKEGVYITEQYVEWQKTAENRFNKLKTNEEHLNQIFIDIYGLHEELSASVLDKDITVRKADIQRDIRSLLSYAVGCMFGRYSLDFDGLAFAGGTWDTSNYYRFVPDEDNVIPITDEEYMEDDIISRLCIWLKAAYGESTLEENLDFIANTLGGKGSSSREIIRYYFLNDFFKDHCQTYSVTGSGKRPIYWLFDSGKQNGFKALIYLHRYNVDTIGNLRIDYLHRMQRIYESEIGRMQDMIDHSTNAREAGQATKRKDKLTKQLKECREYDEKLAHLALSRIELDLDDGVKVNYRKIQTANDGKFYEVLADSKNIMAKK